MNERYSPSLPSRTLAGCIFVNVLLAVVKVLSGIVGNSQALIADGIESLLDIFSSLVVWGGLKVAIQPPDAEHPYGHGRAETLSSMVVAVILLLGAAAIAIESVREIYRPQSTPAVFTLFVLVGVIVVKEVLYRVLRALSRQQASLALQADAWHQRADAFTSLAALIGISVSLYGGSGYEIADDIAALLAAGIICFNGLRILRHGANEIMDSALHKDLESKLRALSLSVPQVRGVDQCRVRKSGLQFLVDIHIIVDGNLSVRDGHDIARAVRKTLFQSELGIQDTLVHIEPDG